MSTTLFAVRSMWIGILIILVAVCAGWFLVRTFLDFAEWFKEEIIEDFRDKRRKAKPRPEPAERVVDEEGCQSSANQDG